MDIYESVSKCPPLGRIDDSGYLVRVPLLPPHQGLHSEIVILVLITNGNKNSISSLFCEKIRSDGCKIQSEIMYSA
jgi:hypothetical protein